MLAQRHGTHDGNKPNMALVNKVNERCGKSKGSGINWQLWRDDRTWVHLVEKVFPGIHPDFGNTSGIFVDNLGHTSRKRVG